MGTEIERLNKMYAGKTVYMRCKSHPHFGATVKITGAENTKLGLALRMHNPNSGEDFYCFDANQFQISPSPL